jgi:hypothetical protein
MRYCVRLAMALLVVLTSCKRMPLENSTEFVRDHKGLDNFHFYTVPAGNQIVCEFIDGNSFSSYVGIKTNIVKTASAQRLEISFTARIGYVPSSKFERIDSGAFATVIPLESFDVRKWDVVYRDESGTYPINYGGILREPLKPYVPGPGDGPVTNL